MSLSSLPADLTDAEKELVEKAKNGRDADYRKLNKELDDPANGANWGPERTIRAEVIYALAVGNNPNVHAKGVRIRAAKIVGTLDLSGAKIPHPLGLFNSFIAEPITLRDADALSVNLAGSCVAGIKADRLHTRGSVFLRNGFHAMGEVRLLGAKIGGQLACSGGTFEHAVGTALHADGATVAGDVFLSERFHAKGEVRLLGARIGGQFSCSGGTFENANGIALNLERASVTATFFLRQLPSRPVGAVVLAYAEVGELGDDENSWPDDGKLDLYGFVYGRLAGDAPFRARDRLRWLGLQPDFRPQPYEQLIKVLKEMGHEQEAREIAIAKQQRLRADGGLSRLSRAKNWLLDKTIKYGYESWRAFILLFVVWFIGTGMFCMAEWTGLMVPSEKEAYDPYGAVLKTLPQSYPVFHAPLYAIDTLLPGIDLHQKSKWYLRERNSGDLWYWVFEAGGFIYFVICWILTLLGVGAVTGLIKTH